MTRVRATRPDRGSVLLETAFAIPVLIAVTVALVWAISLGATYIRVLDVAQTAARQVARGGVPAPVPEGTVMSVAVSGDTVRVIAWREVGAPVPILRGISVRIEAEATAAREEVPPWSG